MTGNVPPKFGFEFLLNELDLGLTFTRIALDASPADSDKVRRNRAHAQKAYETFLHYHALVDLDPGQHEILDTKLMQFKSALHELDARRTRDTSSH